MKILKVTLSLTLMALSLLLMPTVLLAETKENNFYTEIDALYLSSPGDFDGEQTMGFTFGYELNNKHAIEAELQINGLDSTEPGYEVDADIFTYLLGYRYSLIHNQNHHIYLGLGLGVGDAEYSFTETKRMDDTLNVGFARIGASYNITENSYISGELRYQHFDDIELQSGEAKIGDTLITGISFGYRF